MKKRGLFVYLIIFNLLVLFMKNVAGAQYISIGRFKYPSIIIIPIVSIVVSLLILIVLIVRAFKRQEKAFVGDIVHKIQKETKKANKLKHNDKEDKEKETNYLAEIKRFKRHLHEFESDRSFEILSQITKKFFKELLGLKYEFTYNELAKELKNQKKRKELIDISQRFSELKYSGSKVSKEELEKFAEELETMLRKEKRKKEEEELGVSKAFQHKKGFFRGIADSINLLKKDNANEKERKKKIFETIQEEEEALKKDMDIAKNIYHKMLASYYKLPPHDRKEVYEKLTKFYKEINEMLFSSFYSEKSKKQLEYFASKLAQIKEEEEKVKGKYPVEESRPKKEKVHVRAEEKAKPHLEVSDLNELDRIEGQAKERIKLLGESIVKHAISAEMMNPAEKKKKSLTLPQIHQKPLQKTNIHDHVRAINIKEPEKKSAAGITHEHGAKKSIHPSKELKTKIEKVHELKHPKTRKLQKIEKEAEQIKAKLAKLQQETY